MEGYSDGEVVEPNKAGRGVNVGYYVAERKQPGISIDQLNAAQSAAIAMCRRFTAEGKAARYIRATLIPSEARCLTLFEAISAKVVQELNEAAQIPFDRILEAIELTA
jgi:hypothetical protein